MNSILRLALALKGMMVKQSTQRFATQVRRISCFNGESITNNKYIPQVVTFQNSNVRNLELKNLLFYKCGNNFQHGDITRPNCLPPKMFMAANCSKLQIFWKMCLKARHKVLFKNTVWGLYLTNWRFDSIWRKRFWEKVFLTKVQAKELSYAVAECFTKKFQMQFLQEPVSGLWDKDD